MTLSPQQRAAQQRAARQFAAESADILRRLRALETQSQLARSAVQDGALSLVNNGVLTGTVGRQYDGTTGAVTHVSPIPPTPHRPEVRPVPGGLVVRWDGTFVDPPSAAPVTAAPLPAMHRVGISSSREGLIAGETHKRQATLDRYAEMAAESGTTAAALRAAGGRHVYDQSTSIPAQMTDIGAFSNCVDDGYGCVMLTSSTWSNPAAIANGTATAALTAFFNSVPAGVDVIFNWEHEPSNNDGGWPSTAPEKAEWRMGQARIAKLIWELDKDNLHYTDCHIPMVSDLPEWNWLPELQQIAPSDWQAINARTYIGMDPYPEIGSGGTVQTIQQKVGDGLAYLRAQGRTGPLCLPEVALFNWVIATSSTGTLSAAQQAQRLHDELWTWGQANDLLAYFYYDVADLNDADVRDSSRTLDTPAELLEYGKLIRGDYYGAGAGGATGGTTQNPVIVAPLDFTRVDVVVSTAVTPDFIATPPSHGFPSPRGSEVFLALPVEPHKVALVTRTAAGTPSLPSVSVTATPEPETAPFIEALNRTFRQTTAPTSTAEYELRVNDTWFDTDDGNQIYLWDGDSWETAQDAGIADAEQAAAAAQAAAQAAADDAAAAAGFAAASNRVFRQTTPPVTDGSYTLRVGDTWYDTDDGNLIRVWDGDSWESAQDGDITAAQSAAAAAQATAASATTAAANAMNYAGVSSRVYRQAAQPTVDPARPFVVGDTWYDTDDGNFLRVWDGDSWEIAQDASIATAQAAAAAAQVAADAAMLNAENKVANGSFEDGFIGWNKNAAMTLDATTALTGDTSAKGEGAVSLNQTAVPVVPGRTYRYSYWYKTTAGYAPTAAVGNRPLKYFPGPVSDGNISGYTNTSVNTAWTLNTFDWLVPAGIATAHPFRMIGTVNAGEAIWVEDIRFTDVTEIKVLEAAAAAAQTTANSAQSAAAAAQATASSATTAAANAMNYAGVSSRVYRQAAQPTVDPARPFVVGDTWYDTDDGNLIRVWDGDSWEIAQDADIATAQAAANAAVTTYVTEYAVHSSETTAPTTGWSTATPTRTPGTFIWQRVTVTYGNGGSSTTNPALLTGNTGAAGANAPAIALTATTQVLTSPSTGGATNPTTATVTGTAVNTTITAWTYSVDGAAFSATVPAGVSRTGNVVTITGSTMTARTITVRMADAAGVADTLTVAKVSDGAPGAPGGAGAAGADAYTVLLTNESHTFPGGTTAALAGSTTSQVIAYKGTAQQSATIGTITGQVTGLTTAITSNGTTAPVVTITVTTSLTATNGELTIPVTVDGTTFTKKLSWTVSRQGSQGGAGADGVSITALTPYYAQVTTGAAAPTQPSTATPVAPWVATEPGWVLNTELYRTDKITYSNGSFTYTAVTKVSSYTASSQAMADAQQAIADAADAMDFAEVASRVYRQAAQPTVDPARPFVVGDQWYDTDDGNRIKVWDGAAWVDLNLGFSALGAVIQTETTAARGVKINSTGLIGYDTAGVTKFLLTTAGALSLTGAITSSTMDSSTVTGGTLQTESTAARGIKINSSGLIGYNASGVAQFTLTTAGALTLVGPVLSGGTVTGATLQTETTAARGVKMTTSGLFGYDATGVSKFSLTTAGVLSVAGALTSGSTIDGAVVTGGTVQTESTASRGIKINSTGFTAYDNAGVATFTITAATGAVSMLGSLTTGSTVAGATVTGGTVTGATVQTETTAARGVKMTTSGLFGYDATGIPQFSLTTAGVLSVAGAITSGSTVDGAIVTGGTIQTESTASRGIKINSTGLTAYNGSGVATLTVTAATGALAMTGPVLTGGTVTGATLQTETTAARGVKMTTGGLFGYNSTGTTKFSLTVGGVLSVTDSISTGGSIDGAIVTGGTVQTETTASRGIKMNSTALIGYDGTGATKFSLTTAGVLTLVGALQTGGTITGPTFQTEATASRGIKINTTGMYGYNSTGTTKFSLTVGGVLSVTDSISTGGSIDGATVTGGTIQTEDTPLRGIKMNSSALIGYDSTGAERFKLLTSAGATITGGVFQTEATAARGVKIDTGGLTGYDSVPGSPTLGQQTFRIDAATGAVSIKGTLTSGSTMTGGTVITQSGSFRMELGNFGSYGGGLNWYYNNVNNARISSYNEGITLTSLWSAVNGGGGVMSIGSGIMITPYQASIGAYFSSPVGAPTQLSVGELSVAGYSDFETIQTDKLRVGVTGVVNTVMHSASITLTVSGGAGLATWNHGLGISVPTYQVVVTSRNNTAERMFTIDAKAANAVTFRINNPTTGAVVPNGGTANVDVFVIG